ncbi:hypothetical protein [Allokutzneria sp. NRRL B-24872]|uniref:hypothetical protein n=1 Tax=Allokutzneria sp. NRRL B-24872 TaxID=1137961 RepID=UPI000A3940ED|nr:hypothetical protein [Allokutzneria sp. NRRL B-24872]
MTQRVVAGASAVLFILLALVTHLMVDMHDRAFPVELGPASSINLDFGESGLGEDAAIELLRSWNARAEIGLLKQTADLGGDLRGKVFIELNEARTAPDTIGWYGDEPRARVLGSQEMATALPSGTYLVTGRVDRLPEVIGDLQRHGVTVSRTDPTLAQDLAGLYRLRSLAIAFATGCVLLVTLVLYWLSAKSRGRSLRVLGGTSVARVQVVDMTRFLVLVTTTWAATTAPAVLVVGVWKGWEYTSLFATRMAALGGLMLVLVLVTAAVLSAIATPSADSIARRMPASLGIRRSANLVKAVTFCFVLLAVGPAWSAVTNASATAREMGQWNRLADQVRMSFQGTSEADFQRLMAPFGDLVREVDARGSLALSHLTVDQPDALPGRRWDSVLGRWKGFALVNQRWLDLMQPERSGAAPRTEISRAALPREFVDEFALSLDLWKRPPEPAAAVLERFRFLDSGQQSVPLAEAGGELLFRDDILIVVVPDVWSTFDDSFLVSTASSGNLLFSGLDQTQATVTAHGVGKEVKVRHAAADGILRAQFAAYDAWLGVVSLIGLAVALVVAAAISAYVSALLAARNDFARRLAGHGWTRVMAGRLVPEIALGALVAAVLLLLQPPEHVLPVLVTSVLLIAAAPVAHVLAARRAFADVGARRL